MSGKPTRMEQRRAGPVPLPDPSKNAIARSSRAEDVDDGVVLRSMSTGSSFAVVPAPSMALRARTRASLSQSRLGPSFDPRA